LTGPEFEEPAAGLVADAGKMPYIATEQEEIAAELQGA